jgi:hypothetical protein
MIECCEIVMHEHDHMGYDGETISMSFTCVKCGMTHYLIFIPSHWKNSFDSGVEPYEE